MVHAGCRGGEIYFAGAGMSREIDRTLGGQFQKILERASGNFEDWMLDFAERSNRSESEIEGALATVFFASTCLGQYSGTYNKFSIEMWCSAERFSIDELPKIVLTPNIVGVVQQVYIGDYRVDFLCMMEMWDSTKERMSVQWLAVECDGHEFHEKTKAQAARDKSRDRALLLRGIPCMRFTGSEIWKDPYACVYQVDRFFHDALMRFFGMSQFSFEGGPEPLPAIGDSNTR